MTAISSGPYKTVTVDVVAGENNNTESFFDRGPFSNIVLNQVPWGDEVRVSNALTVLVFFSHMQYLKQDFNFSYFQGIIVVGGLENFDPKGNSFGRHGCKANDTTGGAVSVGPFSANNQYITHIDARSGSLVDNLCFTVQDGRNPKTVCAGGRKGGSVPGSPDPNKYNNCILLSIGGNYGPIVEEKPDTRCLCCLTKLSFNWSCLEN